MNIREREKHPDRRQRRAQVRGIPLGGGGFVLGGLLFAGCEGGEKNKRRKEEAGRSKKSRPRNRIIKRPLWSTKGSRGKEPAHSDRLTEGGKKKGGKVRS